MDDARERGEEKGSPPDGREERGERITIEGESRGGRVEEDSGVLERGVEGMVG